MIRQTYHIHTLPNGLRLVCERRPRAAVEYFGVAVMAGSRDERPDEFGIAHFVEHTIFKGTLKRKPWHILNRMESVGGELNAFTTKEETYIYSAYPKGNTARAIELIADLIINSRFPAKQISIERDVVADEIASYLDSPADAIYDDFEDLIFKNSGLGHNILGSEETLKTFTPEKCVAFMHRNYVAGNMVAFYSGPASPESILKLVEKWTGHIPEGNIDHRTSSIYPSDIKFNEVRDIASHQSHTLLGAIVPGIYSDDTPVAALLTNILGGPGMNSLFNLSLRERNGLVYSVEATTTLYRDCGLWSVYFGCDNSDVEKCMSLIREIIDRLATDALTDRRLNQYKRQLSGQMAMSRDNRESCIMSAARSTLYHGTVLTPEKNISRIRAVTPSALRDYAGHLHDLSRLTFN